MLRWEVFVIQIMGKKYDKKFIYVCTLWEDNVQEYLPSLLFITVKGKDIRPAQQNWRVCTDTPSYPPGFDITVPIDYILWNVTKPGVSKYSEHPTLACPEQENLLTAE